MRADAQFDRQKKSARRTALAVGLVAIGIYVAFILGGVLRA